MFYRAQSIILAKGTNMTIGNLKSRQVSKVACLIFSLFIWSVTEASDFTGRLSEVLSTLCPYASVCRNTTDKALDFGLSGLVSCCTDCSCDDECGQPPNDNCCFSKEAESLFDLEECVYPGSELLLAHETHMYTFYKMITRHPIDGCVALTSNQQNNSTSAFDLKGVDISNNSLSDKHTDQQRMSPIYSPKTGRIYRTVELADCHGVRDGVRWPPIAFCKVKTITTSLSGLSHMISERMNTNRSSVCQIHYQPPVGISNLVRAKRCFPDLIKTCPRTFNLTTLPYISLTQEYVQASCESGLFAPYIATANYANVFCHLCNEDVYGIAQMCRSDPIRGLFDDTFTALMDQSSSDLGSNEVSVDHKKDHMVCDVTGEGDCRLVYCPSGEIKNDHACTWSFGELQKGVITIILKVTLSRLLPLEALKQDNYFTVPTWLKKPWPNYWDFDLILLQRSETKGKEDMIGDLIIALRLETTINFNSLLKTFEKYLKKTWVVYYGDERVVGRQTLFEYYSFAVVGTTRPEWKDYIGNASVNLKAPTFDTVFVSAKYGISIPIYITKLVFCDQIGLATDEYKLYSSDLILFVKRTGQVFFDGEFVIIETVNGRVPRICLSDWNAKAYSTAIRITINGSMVSLIWALFVYLAAFLTTVQWS